MSKILKIYDNNKTVSLDVGNIVHNSLAIILNNQNVNIMDVIENEMKKVNNDDSKKSNFYKEKWKAEIIKLVNLILKMNENTDFKIKYLEENFDIFYKRKLDITLNGKIDKVMTYEKDGNTYVMVIDYKTGTINTDFNPVIYGLNMQLLIYYYLLSKNIKNVKPAGFYYQNVIKNLMNREEGKTYEDLLENGYRLEGYTVRDLILLPHIVKNIDNSFIKGLKLKKDGDFSSTSKVLDEIAIQKLLDIVDNNLEEAFSKIENGEFAIAPKRIGAEKVEDATGCKFCPYQDICFHKAKDFIYLKKHEKLDFLEEGEV